MSQTSVSTHPPQPLNSHLEWVTARPAAVWRWLMLIPILMLALLVGPAVALVVSLLVPDSALGELLTKFSAFFGYLVAFAGLGALVLRRPPWVFAFRRRSPEWGLFGTGLLVQVVVSAVATVIMWLVGLLEFTYEQPDPQLLLILVPVAVVGLLFQTGTEEFMIRGGLMQMVYRLTSQPFFIILLTAVAFAFLHISNLPDGAGLFGYTPYLAQGLLLAWVAWRTGSIWFSWGLHFANNAFLTLAIANPDDVYDSVSGVYFEFMSSSNNVLALADTCSTALTFLVVWLILRRRPNAGALARAARAESGRSDAPVSS